ncbi:hypothetical protein A6V36_28205 [Paraburkholderia ginsengiterrae]|uniref:Nuclear transport factor 2 family protein n=1 Tax=Paraburkholderia ginsengiterrae TaxID=1462993 RepID=A0A1A9N790_9BURK|nr:nuclear transport factor 2 family protein [Paraburkholderia ginsengiterrae]OAJ59223.1 hypothetical protein A6V36_28205 [Paraburkholderia ginsengiterrae]OAJ60165.1 hypothetical protein A6V37_25810 [Paraburkholderia ginsengiterrae]
MTHASTQIDDATLQVFDHHLGAFAQGLDELLKDYGESSTIITPDKTYRGLAEIRAFFKAFIDSADPAFWPAFKVTSKSTAGDVAYLAWEAKPWVTLATDTLVVREGKIVVQTFTAVSG